MPELDNSPMSLAKYLSVLGPFEVLVTLLILCCVVYVAYLVGDLLIRSFMGEKP